VATILIIDTETSGLDPKVDRVLEVGAVLYSIDHATALESFSSLMEAPDNPCENINRIPPAALRDAPAAGPVWGHVMQMAAGATAFVAHHAAFDESFTPEPVRRLLPWVCSKSDLQWPKQTKPEPSLVALALEHDLGVAVAHRALADCELLARLFTRARELGADLGAMLARGLRPKAEFVSLAPFEQKDVVKAHGFAWFPDRKEWRRRMAIEDAAALPFRVRQLAVLTGEA